MEPASTYHIPNLGAGVQSTALYLMFLDGEFDEKLDYAVFADTQEEPEPVYAHLEWLRSLGGPPILTDTAGKLGDDLIHGQNSTGQRFASIPAFTSAEPGKPGGMLRRQCTAEYKINVVERVIRRQVVGLEYRPRMPRGVKVVQYFGLSFDEPRRVSKVRNRFVGHPWSEARFPLFDLEMSRGECVEYRKGRSIPHTRSPAQPACSARSRAISSGDTCVTPTRRAGPGPSRWTRRCEGPARSPTGTWSRACTSTGPACRWPSWISASGT